MKNAKLTVIVSVCLAVVLFACAFIFKFTRDVQADWTNVYRVELNDDFNASDVEAIMKEAGAKECLVQKEITLKDAYTTKDATRAVVYFKADDAQKVFESAENLLSDKYFLKYEGAIYTLSGTLTYKTILEYWPLLIVLAAIAVYLFISFGVKGAVSSVADAAIVSMATVGLISITHVGVGEYTVPACVATASLAFALNIAFNLIGKVNGKKISGKENAIAASVKEMNVLTVVLCAIAAAVLVIALIFGGVVTKKFALTALIGTVVNAIVALFVMPAFAKFFCKVK